MNKMDDDADVYMKLKNKKMIRNTMQFIIGNN